MNTGRVPKRNHIARVQRLARERAEAQARRIPWQLHARNEYVDWQEFYLWVRSVLESESRVPDWLIEILTQRCPGFVGNERELTTKSAKNPPLSLRLEDWIDHQIFGFAKQEGWFNAITYYAIRDPRYQRAEVCWSQCVKSWKKAKPLRYPTLDEWKLLAEHCDPTAHLVSELRERLACVQRVDPVRFAEAISRYIDFEALAYWARPALEHGSEMPKPVVAELRNRCPGLNQPPHMIGSGSSRVFQTTTSVMPRKKGGSTCPQVMIRVQSGPWNMQITAKRPGIRGWPNPYPSFEEWRANADSFVEKGKYGTLA